MAKLISNSFGVSNFRNMRFDGGNIVVVINAFNPIVAILRLDDDEEAYKVVTSYIRGLNNGTSYRYEIVSIIGNTFFCN